MLDFIASVLTGDLVKGRSSGFNRNDVLRFAMRVQQYTAPVMAKAIEDTAFYRFPRLLSLNEVGGDPQRFAVSPGAFHAANEERRRAWPHTLLATATHDTKRGEDARIRIDVLSEIPAQWTQAVRRWRRFNRSRYDAELTASAFSERLRNEVDIQTVAAELDTTVRRAMAPGGVGIWLREARR
jgi:(1->4)-alpha-D-glucan 1-alpha-D-glucosylmutase